MKTVSKKHKCSCGLVIGRFQPFHNAHHKLIKAALERHQEVLIAIGSYRQARDIRNPFTYEERMLMISDSLTQSERARIRFAPIRDYLYNENLWLSEVQMVVDEAAGGKPVQLVGHNRDASSYYLDMFPQWGFDEVGKFDGDISASEIRNDFFSHGKISIAFLPNAVQDFLEHFMTSSEYQGLVDEYGFIQKYKTAWKAAPYPPTFQTTDCVVVKSGHILVVKRKGMPGKGLMALPGGFLQQNETTLDGAIRELREETGIAVDRTSLKKSVVSSEVFDHPLRSLRGRTITRAFCIDLGSGPLPRVKGMDDAEKANWMPLHEAFANDDKFFEDHWHIINYFLSALPKKV